MVHRFLAGSDAVPETRVSRGHARPAARGARRRVIQLLHDLWRNDDALKCKVARHVLDGGHLWLEQGIMPLGFSAEDLQPPSVTELLKSRRARRESA